MPHAHPSGFPPRTSGRPKHGEGQALALRGRGRRFSTKKPSHYCSAGALGCHTRIRAGFPRECPLDRSMARDRPSPYAEGGSFSTKKPSRYCSARACPPRTSGRPKHGEGQAFALRGRGGRFSTKKSSRYRSAEAFHRDVEPFMKHPDLVFRFQSIRMKNSQPAFQSPPSRVLPTLRCPNLPQHVLNR